MAIVNTLLVKYANGYHESKVRLINPVTGRPAFTGPSGEPGSAVMVGALTTEWTMPDGVTAWYQTGAAPDPGNLAALANYPITVYGRCEALIQLGAASDPVTADAICQQIFALEATPLVAVSAILETGPAGTSDVPYDAYDIGDYITAPAKAGAPAAQRVVAITVAEDQDGNLTFTPQYNGLIFEEDERLQNWLKSMSSGTVGGTAAVAQPVAAASQPTVAPGTQAIGSAALNELPPWSMSGGLVAVTWGSYKMPIDATFAYLNVELDQAATSTVEFQIVVNGTAVAGSQVSIATGTSGATPGTFSYRASKGDVVEMQCVTPGTGVDTAVCQIGYA